MTLKDLERVLYFENFVVIEPGMTSLARGQLLSEEEFYDAQDEFGDDAFEASIGAEAIKKVLEELDLDDERVKIRTELAKLGLRRSEKSWSSA